MYRYIVRYYYCMHCKIVASLRGDLSSASIGYPSQGPYEIDITDLGSHPCPLFYNPAALPLCHFKVYKSNYDSLTI